MVTTSSVTGAEVILSNSRRKLSGGSKLTTSEKMSAMSATATQARENYGPTPTTMEPHETRIPENVKGAIADSKG